MKFDIIRNFLQDESSATDGYGLLVALIAVAWTWDKTIKLLEAFLQVLLTVLSPTRLKDDINQF
ncbi:Flp family type IVb pilin [Candidatus Liberibacter solanacearum]|uniref:Flp family type IVb pilin n=1 Tax=Candidatus Liberibacter solanacearum TaxID=556287 RepID=UPI00387DC3F8